MRSRVTAAILNTFQSKIDKYLTMVGGFCRRDFVRGGDFARTSDYTEMNIAGLPLSRRLPCPLAVSGGKLVKSPGRLFGSNGTIATSEDTKAYWQLIGPCRTLTQTFHIYVSSRRLTIN